MFISKLQTLFSNKLLPKKVKMKNLKFLGLSKVFLQKTHFFPLLLFWDYIFCPWGMFTLHIKVLNFSIPSMTFFNKNCFSLRGEFLHFQTQKLICSSYRKNQFSKIFLRLVCTFKNCLKLLNFKFDGAFLYSMCMMCIDS